MDGLLLLLASSSFLLKRSYSSPAKEVVIALLARVNQFVGRDALSLFPQGTICFTIQPQYTSLDTLHAKSVTSDCLFCVFPHREFRVATLCPCPSPCECECTRCTAPPQWPKIAAASKAGTQSQSQSQAADTKLRGLNYFSVNYSVIRLHE